MFDPREWARSWGIKAVETRWPENSDGVEAPEGICGDHKCACADKARMIMTDAEYRLAFGVPKEFGLDPEDLAAFQGSTAVTMTGDGS
jgi:hypothetical protein